MKNIDVIISFIENHWPRHGDVTTISVVEDEHGRWQLKCIIYGKLNFKTTCYSMYFLKVFIYINRYFLCFTYPIALKAALNAPYTKCRIHKTFFLNLCHHVEKNVPKCKACIIGGM